VSYNHIADCAASEGKFMMIVLQLMAFKFSMGNTNRVSPGTHPTIFQCLFSTLTVNPAFQPSPEVLRVQIAATKGSGRTAGWWGG